MARYNDDDFKRFVSNARKYFPSYNHGRNVVIYTEDTKCGQDILSRASRWEGNNLNQVYDRPSKTKKEIFNACWEMYANDINASSFGICSHNGFMFTVSWVTENDVVYLTRDTEYHVLCRS